MIFLPKNNDMFNHILAQKLMIFLPKIKNILKNIKNIIIVKNIVIFWKNILIFLANIKLYRYYYNNLEILLLMKSHY